MEFHLARRYSSACLFRANCFLHLPIATAEVSSPEMVWSTPSLRTAMAAAPACCAALQSTLVSRRQGVAYRKTYRKGFWYQNFRLLYVGIVQILRKLRPEKSAILGTAYKWLSTSTTIADPPPPLCMPLDYYLKRRLTCLLQ